ncbi:Maf family protein [bacterium]|nr:Maf family protein [bacterium]
MGEPPELILASGSPRRTALLAAVGVSHRVEPSNCRETWDENRRSSTWPAGPTGRRWKSPPDCRGAGSGE